MTPMRRAAMTKRRTIEALEVWICGAKASDELCDDGAEMNEMRLA
jgi:hypothetical protein